MEQLVKNKANAMAKSGGSKNTIQDLMKVMQPEIAKALPSVISPERFTRITLSALSSNPKLAQCTPKSFLASMMTSAQLGMEVNTPLQQAFLIPFLNHGVMECQFQLGYKGLIDLAYRSGEVDIIQAQIVYENDEFEYQFGLEPKLMHKPAMKDRGNPIAVYGMFRTKSGGFGFEVMSMDDCRRHAEKYSKAYGSSSSPWKTSFEEMCKKTVLKKVLKYAPLKSDFVRAVSADETIKTSISDDMFSVQDETVYEADYETVDGATGEVIEEAQA